MDGLLEKHGAELVILLLVSIVCGTLLVLVPQLLRQQQRAAEMQHAEHLKAMDQGQSLPPYDVRSRAAGRAAGLVPIVAVISAATVTCFLVVNKSEALFSVTVAVWAVTGVVCLAAVTSGVALLGRLAQLDHGGEEPDEELGED